MMPEPREVFGLDAFLARYVMSCGDDSVAESPVSFSHPSSIHFPAALALQCAVLWKTGASPSRLGMTSSLGVNKKTVWRIHQAAERSVSVLIEVVQADF